jgi:Helix-turn-helix domain
VDDDEIPERAVTRLSDPKALRAYAHPVRMRLVGVLRTQGPLTATQAGRLLGESSGTCSFHLRQLARYGLVEEAGGGRGREKPWRATAAFTAWDEVQETPEATAAAGLLTEAVAQWHFAKLMRWLAVRAGESEQWQRAALIGDRGLWVTADELAEIGEQVRAVTDKYFERQATPELRPAGARLASFVYLGFPDVTLPEES